MLVAVTSLKSGGATTVAAALAAVWPEPACLIEADPAGGDLGGRHRLPDAPGLASLANACRTGQADLTEHATRLPFGVDVVLAAAGRPQASAAIGLLADTEPARWAKERPIVLDVGRLEPGSPALPLLELADMALVVAGGDVLSLLRVSLADIPVRRAGLVTVGPLTHPREDLAGLLPLPLVAAMPWDRHSAEVIAGTRRPRKAWTRVGLPATARALAATLATPTIPAGGDPR
ncbi:MinD/ParA family ATP-binding protein [Micromonospora inaquosa]|uniref:Chromosome partitioning protein n=1 Tax=Micromonospora inaquosa TaxID=2203716 RepID=A0A3N9W425_9ACTN|nr:chromosome partitioning protein [Micromonospora inaquosa]RQW95535.1 chromosome partitioning protein [Micromonospora inaquosa]